MPPHCSGLFSFTEMNREIKFRAWDNDRKQFVPQGEIVFSNYGDNNIEVHPNDQSYIGDTCHNGEPQRGRFSIQQFTGLLDKNGKEIYEGDICKAYQTLYETPSPLTVQIIYNAEFARFEPVQFWKSQNKWLSLSGEFKSNYDFEIIGNIYETPIEQATT